MFFSFAKAEMGGKVSSCFHNLPNLHDMSVKIKLKSTKGNLIVEVTMFLYCRSMYYLTVVVHFPCTKKFLKVLETNIVPLQKASTDRI